MPVIKFPGTEATEDDKATVKFFEAMLEKAKAGEIESALVIYLTPQGGAGCKSSAGLPAVETIGMLELLKQEILLVAGGR